jgi:hypothetical protein
MKRKISRLLPPGPDKVRDVVIRSIDDESYPNTDVAPVGRISGWFKSELKGLYHNRIELYLQVESIIVDEANGRWAFVNFPYPDVRAVVSVKTLDPARYSRVEVFRIGRIPFRNIIEIDEEGDEYYRLHFYCRFADAGLPYELVLQREVDGYREYHPEAQFPLAELVRLTP